MDHLSQEEIELVNSILNAGRKRPLGASAGSQPSASAQATARVPAASDETLEATVRSILAAGKVQKPLGAPAAVSYPDASVTSPTTLQTTAEERELVNSILVAGKVRQPKPPTPAKANPVPAAPARAQPSVPTRDGFFPATLLKVAVSDQVARDVRTYKLWFQDRVDCGIQAY